MRIKKPIDVIVYGISGSFEQAEEYIRTRFNIVGCSDTNPQKAESPLVKGVPYYRPESLKEKKYDYIIIASDFDEEISRYLIEEIGIPGQKVLKRAQWQLITVEAEYGEKNPDKTFYVLSKPIRKRDGMYSTMILFLEQLMVIEKNGYIPVVDMKNYASQYLEEDKKGIENAWEYYYEPLSEYSLEEVYQSKNVILGYDRACYTEDYDKKYDCKALEYIYEKYIHLNEKLKAAVENEYTRIIKEKAKADRVLGVVYRGTDIAKLKLAHHSISPSVDEMIQLIHEYKDKWGCEWIYICTEDEKALKSFKAEFKDRLLCTDQKRYADTGDKWLADLSHDRKNDRYLNGFEYIITIELLGKCDSFLAGICSASVCNLMMKGSRYSGIYMVDKGAY